jgi:predicted DNA repair protein MutK
MKPIEQRICIGLIFLFAFFIGYRLTDNSVQNGNFVKIEKDTVKVIQVIQPIHNNYPTKETIQREVDTVFREKVEKGIIITAVEIKGKTVTIQKINPEGVKSEEVHNFEEKKKTKVGKILQKSKKTILRGLQVVGGVAIVYVTLKSL